MSDQGFADRVKRIETRHHFGARAELLAGVSDTQISSAGARVIPALTPRCRASFLLILLGTLTGFFAVARLPDLAILQSFAAMPPEDLLAVLRADPPLAAGATMLTLCALMAVASFLRGRRAVRMMSFSGAALGAAIGATLPALV